MTRAGALDRRAVATAVWRIEHVRRAVVRIEAERTNQLAAARDLADDIARVRRELRAGVPNADALAKEIARLRRTLDRTTAAAETNRGRAGELRAVIAERLDELVELPALARLTALRDRQARELTEITDRLTAATQARDTRRMAALLRRQAALAVAVREATARLDRVAGLVATAPERLLPSAAPPARGIPAGPLGRDLSAGEPALLVAAAHELVRRRGLPAGEVLVVRRRALIAALDRVGAPDAAGLADRAFAIGVVVDGRGVVIMTRAQHALLARIGMLDAVLAHERDFHSGPHARGHDEDAHAADTERLVRMIDAAVAMR